VTRIRRALTGVIIAAMAASRGQIQDPAGGATHCYAHAQVRPDWSRRGIGRSWGSLRVSGWS
jgi:hypothetical protein